MPDLTMFPRLTDVSTQGHVSWVSTEPLMLRLLETGHIQKKTRRSSLISSEYMKNIEADSAINKVNMARKVHEGGFYQIYQVAGILLLKTRSQSRATVYSYTC